MKRFSDLEKERALNLYFDEKLTTAETVRRLGYPTRQNLERWEKRILDMAARFVMVSIQLK